MLLDKQTLNINGMLSAQDRIVYAERLGVRELPEQIGYNTQKVQLSGDIGLFFTYAKTEFITQQAYYEGNKVVTTLLINKAPILHLLSFDTELWKLGPNTYVSDNFINSGLFFPIMDMSTMNWLDYISDYEIDRWRSTIHSAAYEMAIIDNSEYADDDEEYDEILDENSSYIEEKVLEEVDYYEYKIKKNIIEKLFFEEQKITLRNYSTNLSSTLYIFGVRELNDEWPLSEQPYIYPLINLTFSAWLRVLPIKTWYIENTYYADIRIFPDIKIGRIEYKTTVESTIESIDFEVDVKKKDIKLLFNTDALKILLVPRFAIVLTKFMVYILKMVLKEIGNEKAIIVKVMV